jgi:hypothetical protein
MNRQEFPFVNVPKEVLPIVGEASLGTRLYRREGTEDECVAWFEAIGAIFQGDVGLSPGGVVMFVPVSRAAVHKRLREGKLTGFTFHVTSQSKSIWGKPRKLKQRPYLVLSVSECKAWAVELKRKAGLPEEVVKDRARERQNLLSVSDDEEPSSDREAVEATDFVEKDPKDRGNKKVVYKQPGSREAMIELIKLEVRCAVEEALGKLLPGKLGRKDRKRAHGRIVVKDIRKRI